MGIQTKFNKLLNQSLLKNMGWLAVGELITRVFRIGNTLILPILLTPKDYGAIAIILTLVEFIKVFESRRGLNAKLIQSSDEKLQITAETTQSINWVLAVTLFTMQCLSARQVANFYGEPELTLPLCVVAINYLLYPLFSIHAALIYRANNIKVIALCKAVEGPVCNIATLIIAYYGGRYWAALLPAILGSLIWIIILRLNSKWQSKHFGSFHNWEEIANVGVNLLGTEILEKFRDNIDYLIVGSLLGLKALGVYYFAFNAGLGISLTLINIFSGAFYPNIAKFRNELALVKKEYWKSIYIVSVIIAPIIITQAFAAPLYVPLIFGNKWSFGDTNAVPIIFFICLSAVPRIYKVMTDGVLTLIGQSNVIFRADLTFTIIFAGTVWLAAYYFNIYIVSMAVALLNWLFIPAYAHIIYKRFIKNL
jgi:PST family polysaccharide transporter